MRLDRRWVIGGAAIALVLMLGVAIYVKVSIGQDEAQQKALIPNWLRSYQPPDGVAFPLAEPDQAAAKYAGRAGDPGLQAGARRRKNYAPTLADEPSSLVRFVVNAEVD